jgi:hypothetical protein
MISDRIKKLLERINKASDEDDSGLYIVKYLDGVYTCNDPVMICAGDEEFAKWTDTLKKKRTIIIDDIEDAIKHPEEAWKERKRKGLLSIREILEDAAIHPEEYKDDWVAQHMTL